MEAEVNISGLNITLGGCKSGIGPERKKFCFVDEDSPCPKNETQFKALPGTYYSTELCTSQNELKSASLLLFAIGWLIPGWSINIGVFRSLITHTELDKIYLRIAKDLARKVWKIIRKLIHTLIGPGS